MKINSMELANVLRDIEEQLLQPAVRKNTALLNSHIADDFFEIGASGRTYNKAAILVDLKDEPPRSPILLSHFSARLLANNIALVNYRTTRGGTSGEPLVATLRSSIWVHRDNRWQITFHQGTPLP
jgi:hypothetical protein